MRRALTPEIIAECGICVTQRRSSRYPGYYLADLDFADDIASRNMSTAQKILTAVEKSAVLVGLVINRSKTEYMVFDEVIADAGIPEPVMLCVEARQRHDARTEDFKYLGGWLGSPADDFRRRVPQAWQACNSMWRLWKCPTLSQDCKRTLFRATVGTVLLYNAETWTTTRALERRIDGVYIHVSYAKPSMFRGIYT